MIYGDSRTRYINVTTTKVILINNIGYLHQSHNNKTQQKKIRRQRRLTHEKLQNERAHTTTTRFFPNKFNILYNNSQTDI